jgi:hypothetical protein
MFAISQMQRDVGFGIAVYCVVLLVLYIIALFADRSSTRRCAAPCRPWRIRSDVATHSPTPRKFARISGRGDSERSHWKVQLPAVYTSALTAFSARSKRR